MSLSKSEKKAIKNSMAEAKNDKRIIWGFYGIGKSTVADGENIIDADSKRFEFNVGTEEGLHGNKIEGIQRNEEYPENYIRYVKGINAGIILVNCHPGLLKRFEDVEIVYPAKELKGEYLERYRDRGDDPSFVAYMDETFEQIVDYIDRMPQGRKYKIEEKGVYLSDVIFKQKDIKRDQTGKENRKKMNLDEQQREYKRKREEYLRKYPEKKVIEDYPGDKDLVMEILYNLPEEKRKGLEKQLKRNEILTSSYVLEHAWLYDMKGKDSKTSGFYLELLGTRAKFAVYLNNDMEYIRKPKDIEIKRWASVNLSESDFFEIMNAWDNKEIKYGQKMDTTKRLSELVLMGLKDGTVRLIDDPNGDEIVAQIGDNWFYFENEFTFECNMNDDYKGKISDEWGSAFVWNGEDTGVEYNYCVDGTGKEPVNESAIYKTQLNKESGYIETDYGVCSHYEIDFNDGEWREKLEKEMKRVYCEFFPEVVAKEIAGTIEGSMKEENKVFGDAPEWGYYVATLEEKYGVKHDLENYARKVIDCKDKSFYLSNEGYIENGKEKDIDHILEFNKETGKIINHGCNMYTVGETIDDLLENELMNDNVTEISNEMHYGYRYNVACDPDRLNDECTKKYKEWCTEHKVQFKDIKKEFRDTPDIFGEEVLDDKIANANLNKNDDKGAVHHEKEEVL